MHAAMLQATVAALLLAASFATVEAVPRGTSVLFSTSNNTLLIKSPAGKTTGRILLASTKRVPPGIRFTSGPPVEQRKTFVLAGALSPDSKLAFNPANTNAPADADPSNDKPQIVVTNLAAAKRIATIDVPAPGVKGCNFFALSVVAHGGNPSVGYDNKFIAVGDAAKGAYPVWLLLQCPQETVLAKYSYNVSKKTLKYASSKSTVAPELLGGFQPLAFLYASKRAAGNGLYFVGSSENKIGLFKSSGKTFRRVALIDANGNSLVDFAIASAANRQLFAVGGGGVVKLSQKNGSKPFFSKPGLFVSAIAPLKISTGTGLIAVTQNSSGVSAALGRITPHAKRNATYVRLASVPATYSGSVLVAF